MARQRRFLGLLALTVMLANVAGCGSSHAVDAGVSRDAEMVEDTASPMDSGPTCTLVGDYRLLLAGSQAEISFLADGRWTFDATGLGRGRLYADYSVEGEILTIYNPPPGIPEPALECFSDVAGTYSMTFSADCSSVHFTLVSDPCEARAGWLDDLTMTRATSM